MCGLRVCLSLFGEGDGKCLDMCLDTRTTHPVWDAPQIYDALDASSQFSYPPCYSLLAEIPSCKDL